MVLLRPERPFDKRQGKGGNLAVTGRSAIRRLERQIFGSPNSYFGPKYGTAFDYDRWLRIADVGYADGYSGSRPQPASWSYVSISAGGAPVDRVEWPVFGEQSEVGTASTRPTADAGRSDSSAF